MLMPLVGHQFIAFINSLARQEDHAKMNAMKEVIIGLFILLTANSSKAILVIQNTKHYI